MLTIERKLEIVQKIESGVSRSVLMAQYEVGKTTLYDIFNQREQLKKYVDTGVVRNLKQRKTTKKAKYDHVEQALHTWFCAQRAEGKPVSGEMLVTKCKQFHADFGVTQEFSFSRGWLVRFKVRWSVLLCHKHCFVAKKCVCS